MFPLLLYSLISFQKRIHIIKDQKGFNSSFWFGFHSNGNYSIQIKNEGKNEDLLVFLATENGINQYFQEENLYKPCDITPRDNFHVIHLHDGEANITGIIKNEGKYGMVIQMCSYFHDDLYLDIIYKNPNSYISSDLEPSIGKLQEMSYLSMVLFFIWMINYILYYQKGHLLHLIFTFVIFLNMIEKYILINQYKIFLF